MTSSLCEAFLVRILIVTLRVFEVIFVKFSFGGFSTTGKCVSPCIYLFHLCIVFVAFSRD